MTDDFRWIYERGQSLSLLAGGETLLTYHFGSDTPKPYIHPLRTPGGTILTSFQPSDHVWHRGLWFAWKYINGVNYWEEEPDHNGILVSEGRTVSGGSETVVFTENGTTELNHGLNYVAPDGRIAMREQRRILIQPSEKQELVIDFAHAFHVGDEPVRLEATPVNEETPWGGYSGLGLRAARSLTDCRVVNNSGQIDGEANGAEAVWVDLSGTADGGPEADRAAGLALIDHPDNPRHPSPSYVYYDKTAFGYIGPSLLRHEPMLLDSGSDLRLAYRAVAHDGPADKARLGILAAAFAASHPFNS